ncbi:hypothetical protein PTKIN_Ptkin04bG0169900 [Pterospermum kingtungense]
MQNTLASLWHPVKGVCIKDLGSNLYLFQFFHKLDIQRVERGGPWTFNQQLSLTKRLDVHERPMNVPLFNMSIWVQVHDLSVGFISEKICKLIGDHVGTFIEFDPKNDDGLWKSYMCLRVAVDVCVLLKKRMKLKRAGGDWFSISFQYERLPTLCFYCGIIGHSDQFCERLYDNLVPKFDF